MGSPIGGEKRFFKGALTAEEQRLLVADGRHDDAGDAEAARRPAVGQQLIAQHCTGILLRAERTERVQIAGGGGLFRIGVGDKPEGRVVGLHARGGVVGDQRHGDARLPE